MIHKKKLPVLGLGALLALGGGALAQGVDTIPGMPPVVHPHNIYSETGANHLDPEVAKDPARIYVPNLRSNNVYVIDPQTYTVVSRFKVGKSPQHVVP